MRVKLFLPVTFASMFLALPCLQAQHKGKAEVWLSSADRTQLLAEQVAPLKFQKKTTQTSIVDVDEKQVFQTMDGFGFALTGGSAELITHMDPAQRSELLKNLFGDGKDGISVSYLRVSIGSSDMNDHVFTYDDLPAGDTDPTLAHFDLSQDRADVIPVLKEILAINPRIKILGSPWSAPSWMKTNDKPKDGNLKPEYYPVYAQYFVKYVQAMKAEGIVIDAITAQNEPLNPHNTPSMVMTAEDEDLFIKKDLGPAFRTAGITAKVILYDHNCDRPDYPLTTLKDVDAAPFVDGSGFHLYGGQITAMTDVHDAFPAKNLYFTEQMVVDRPNDPKLHIAQSTSRVMIGATRNWSRNVLLWNLAADPHFGPHTNDGGCPVCEGAITIDGNQVTRNLAYYTVAHFSKFVPPGSTRIESNELPGLPNVAFKTPAGRLVMVVANIGDKDQTFAIRSRGKSVDATLSAGEVGTYAW